MKYRTSSHYNILFLNDFLLKIRVILNMFELRRKTKRERDGIAELNAYQLKDIGISHDNAAHKLDRSRIEMPFRMDL
jgi:uncharacterized protein YjiS (DUF1127 family)